MIPTTRTKEAIKTALAMVIAYGIALSMGWEKPMWAGFAVAFISLSTIGQSLNKGFLRMVGTLAAACFSLTLIALFPQDRWWLIAVLSLFVGWCTFMMEGSKHQYAWNVAGFVSMILCMEAAALGAEHAFDLAVLRTLETGLGILVYTLVTVFVWPSGTRDKLEMAARDLAAAKHALCLIYLRSARDEETEAPGRAARTAFNAALTRFDQALGGAETDSYEVWEVRQQWRRFRGQTQDLLESLERWREALKEGRALDLATLVPEFAALADVLDRRLGAIERMLAGKAPELIAQPIELPIRGDALGGLAHFEKAAFALLHAELVRLETVTRELFTTVLDIKGFAPPEAVAERPSGTGGARRAGWHPGPFLDPDRLSAAVRVMAGIWLADLAWMYTQVPGGVGFVIMSASMGMVLATNPFVRVSQLVVPAAVSTLFAALLYVFVMPQLSSFVGLGLLLFAVTFTVGWLFHTPRQALGRAFGLAMFVTMTGISNEQSYDFQSILSTALMLPLVLALLAVTANIPFSARPEKVFTRLIGRFFHGAEFLMGTMRWGIDDRPTALDRWRRAFHLRQVAAIPAKLAFWARFVDTGLLPGTEPARVVALANDLQSLAYRIGELVDARESPQAASLVRALIADIRVWRIALQDVFGSLSGDPGAADAATLRAGLGRMLARLEDRIEETLNAIPAGALDPQDAECFYRLLGAYRGLSEAVIDAVESASMIAWDPWREARF